MLSIKEFKWVGVWIAQVKLKYFSKLKKVTDVWVKQITFQYY